MERRHAQCVRTAAAGRTGRRTRKASPLAPPPIRRLAPRGRHASSVPAQGRRRARRHEPVMSVSSPFIPRPIATSLLGIAVMLGGALGYWLLPVSALPQVDFPTLQVTTQLPGASPDTVAALVTAPLERQFGRIPSLSTMTSSSSYGLSQITLQFELNR